MTSTNRPSKGREVIPLASGSQFIQASGKLIYDKKAEAWNTLKIRSSILKTHPSCPKKTRSVPYTMIVADNHEELKEAIKGMEGKKIIPMLLFLYEEGKHDS